MKNYLIFRQPLFSFITRLYNISTKKDVVPYDTALLKNYSNIDINVPLPLLRKNGKKDKIHNIQKILCIFIGFPDYL